MYKLRLSKRGLWILALSVLIGCESTKNVTNTPPQTESNNSHGFSLLHINDVYRIEGLNEGRLGGLPRVRAIRAELERNGEDVLFLHGGDLLFPSPMSDEFNGLQMISTLNAMDGNINAHDSRMFAVFGNHEFDKSKLSEVGVLEDAVAASDFVWLASNIEFTGSKELEKSPNIVDYRLIQFKGITVGLFGLTTNVKTPDYARINNDYVGIARLRTKLLRAKGADVVIALTHLPLGDDRQILDLKDAGPDIIFGGHEHHRVLENVNGRFIAKADADALSVVIAKVNSASQGISIDVEHRELNNDVKPDLKAKQLVDDWQQRYSEKRCQLRGLSKDCASSVLAQTSVELVAEEKRIRKFETNLGSWVADAALKAFPESGAKISFLNSGSLRLNQNIPAGSIIKQEHLDELLPYPSELVLIEITGAELQKIVNRSVQGWSGNGWWLQVAGFAFEHTPSMQRANRLELITKDGLISVEPEQTIKAVTTEFLINPEAGQDGYTFLNKKHIVPNSNNGIELKSVVLSELVKEPVFSEKASGRICNREHSTPCIFDHDL